uniref:Transcription factor E2F5-like n=1 Tax=Castor canadensis TaxID=51338 RepID=A0A8B7TYN9_CASCN|nr:transcription factor E2F5-like [Castor canadensis]
MAPGSCGRGSSSSHGGQEDEEREYDTLLAVQAPSGTQLEVPIPEMGQNGQKKYQINLKSHSGPIHVLLINKESSSSKPVVFPVPPPDDLTQPSSQSSTPVTPQKPSMVAQNLPEQHVSERSQNHQQMPATEISSDKVKKLSEANTKA